MSNMTIDLLKEALPKNLQGMATQAFADQINAIASDPMVAEEVANNFLTYTKVLAEGKFKTDDYLHAVAYVTHKLMGYNNRESYVRTFPARYQALVAKGSTDKDISAYVSAYSKNKLVNLILEQSLIPSWLLNRDIFQRAINTQVRLMDSASSEKVQTEAANSLLVHLKQPEVKKVELDMTVKDTSGMSDLRLTMQDLARRQLELINNGAGARSIARQPLLIEAELVEQKP